MRLNFQQASRHLWQRCGRGAVFYLALRLSLAGLTALTACSSNDTGKACSNPNQPVPTNPIAGENPVATLNSLYRDQNCQSFQCLTDNGLAPYCTQACSTSDATSPPSGCVNDSNCSSPAHCVGSQCVNDNCPQGFWCQIVQTVGTNANQTYCERRGCQTDLDCGNINSFSCVTEGCFDQCLQDPNCSAHILTCQPVNSLNCLCSNGANSCQDSLLQCQPSGQSTAWPLGAVSRQGVCLPTS